MDRRLIDGLLGAVNAEEISHNTTVARMLSGRGIGLRRGARLVLHASDRSAIRDILTEAGISPTMAPGAFRGMDRIEAAAHSRKEKLAGKRTGEGTILYAHLPTKTLTIGNEEYRFPPGHYGRGAGETLDVISRSRHRAIIMVENEAVLFALSRWPWPLPEVCGEALVLFRGSPQEPARPVRDLLNRLALPVYVAGDLDPAGLGIALTTPHYAGLIRPPVADLENLLRGAGDQDLFGDQLRQWGRKLDACTDPDISAVWCLIRDGGRGLTQEAMIAHGPTRPH